MPEMRDEFAIWLKALLSSKWMPIDLSDKAPYLRKGTGRESRFSSHFYAAYSQNDCAFIIQGFLDQVEITIKPPATDMSPIVLNHFKEAAALHEMENPGFWGSGQSYKNAVSRELKGYLRSLAEQYINPLSLPRDESQWENAVSNVSARWAGFYINWVSDGYKSALSSDQILRLGEAQPYVTLWTNGKVIRISLGHSNAFAHDLSEFTNNVPNRRPASVTPLNPTAVELWDMANWFAEGGPVDDPARATSMMSCVVVKAPYAPNVGVGESGEETGGQPWWSNETLLPMTPLKWHIAEFAALTGGTALDLGKNECAYQDSFSGQISTATNRQKLLDEAKIRRDKCAAISGRFASLAYPPEVRAERDEFLAAIRANLNAWDAAITFWQSVVQEFPDASEAFYNLRATGLSEQLTNAELANTAERIEKAANACAVPLYRKFGLER
jgi:hypothetical protein